MSSLNKIKAIVCREFMAYFNSALAYVFLTIFLILGALLTFKLGAWFSVDEASLRIFFKFHPFIYLIFVPAVGMRVWSEEENQGTLELLLTMPISVWHAVVGKYIAGWLFIGFALFLTFPMVITVSYLGDPDPGRIFSGYLGSFLTGGMFLSITSLASAFTRNQVISFLFGFTAIILLVVVGMPQLGLIDYLKGWVPESFIDTITFFSILPHYEGLEKGVLDIRDVLYFLSFTIFGLIGSTIILRCRKAAHKHNRLISFCGIAVFCVILLLVNYLCRGVNMRYDLSEDRLYTLTDSTKQVLSKIKGPVSVRFYFSKSDTSNTIERKAFALRIEDLLKEYSAITNGLINYKILDPRPESVEETSAQIDGIKPMIKADRTKGYFGLSVTYKDNIRSIAMLDESQENQLEYYLTQIFRHLVTPVRKRIGVLTDYHILEQKANPMAGQYKDKPAWRIIEELRADNDLFMIDKRTDWRMGNLDFDLVILFRFEPLSDESRFALDQYLMRGGKLMMFTDSFPIHGSEVDRTFKVYLPNRLPYYGNTLGVTESWGIAFNNKNMIVDKKHSTRLKNGDYNQAVLTLEGDALNHSYKPLEKIEKVMIPYAGFFQVRETKGISVTPILQSSPDAYLADVKDFRKAFKGESKKIDGARKGPFPIALQVKGKLPSFYKGPKMKTQLAQLKEPAGESEVILFGDLDFLKDEYATTVVEDMGRQKQEKISDNTDMLLNIIDGLTTGGDYIDIRMRKEKKRRLDYLLKQREVHFLEFKKDIDEQQKKLNENTLVVNELHRKQENQITLTDEEVVKLKEAEDLIQDVTDRNNALQDKLNQKQDAIKKKIVFYNTAAIPLLIILSWLLVTLYRKRRLVAG